MPEQVELLGCWFVAGGSLARDEVVHEMTVESSLGASLVVGEWHPVVHAVVAVDIV